MVYRKKTKTEVKPKRYIVYVVVFSVIAIPTLLLAAISTIHGYNQRQESREVERLSRDIQLQYDLSKLQFCYDHDIKPCTDDKIIEFNQAQQSGEGFKLRDWQAINEDALKQVQLNQRYLITGQ